MVTTAWRHLGKQSHSGKHAVLDKVRLTCPMLCLPVSKALMYIFRSPTSLFFGYVAASRPHFYPILQQDPRFPSISDFPYSNDEPSAILENDRTEDLQPQVAAPIQTAVGCSLLMRQILPSEVRYSSIPTGCVCEVAFKYRVLNTASCRMQHADSPIKL
jgi:hypothetical protein